MEIAQQPTGEPQPQVSASVQQQPQRPAQQPQATEKQTESEGSTMTETTTKNFFENPMATSSPATASGWSAAGGALVGALVGNGGLGNLGGGNREQTVTPDQLGTALGNLQGQMNTDALQAHLGRIQGQIAGSSADSTIALGAGIAGIKDAVVAASGQNALSLCGLGHTVQSGFAGVNQTILMQGAAQQLLTVQQALDAERARATELRIELSESRSRDMHRDTQLHITNTITSNNVNSAAATSAAQTNAVLANMAQVLTQLSASVAKLAG